MAEKNGKDDFLDDLFAEARNDGAAEVSSDLMMRVLADAEALQPDPEALSVAPAPRRSLIRSFFDALGGWQGTSGLVAATMASVWIGFNGADTLSLDGLQTVISVDADYYLSDLGGDFVFDIEEG